MFGFPLMVGCYLILRYIVHTAAAQSFLCVGTVQHRTTMLKYLKLCHDHRGGTSVSAISSVFVVCRQISSGFLPKQTDNRQTSVCRANNRKMDDRILKHCDYWWHLKFKDAVCLSCHGPWKGSVRGPCE